jgi:hypothetical protein
LALKQIKIDKAKAAAAKQIECSTEKENSTTQREVDGLQPQEHSDNVRVQESSSVWSVDSEEKPKWNSDVVVPFSPSKANLDKLESAEERLQSTKKQREEVLRLKLAAKEVAISARRKAAAAAQKRRTASSVRGSLRESSTVGENQARLTLPPLVDQQMGQLPRTSPTTSKAFLEFNSFDKASDVPPLEVRQRDLPRRSKKPLYLRLIAKAQRRFADEENKKVMTIL